MPQVEMDGWLAGWIYEWIGDHNFHRQLSKDNLSFCLLIHVSSQSVGFAVCFHSVVVDVRFHFTNFGSSFVEFVVKFIHSCIPNNFQPLYDTNIDS